MSEYMQRTTCRNCGAPITSEVCQYCGCRTGLSPDEVIADYPVIECKEANLGFWSIVFPLIFGFAFGSVGIGMPIALLASPDFGGEMRNESPVMLFLFLAPFAAVGIGSLIAVIKPIMRYITLKRKGKLIKATVFGYTNDDMRYNGRPTQVVKLLADTPVGKRILMYQLGNTTRPYGINTELELLVYDDIFMIVKKKEIIKW